MNMKSIKTYSELITLPSFIERFRYIKLNGQVGEKTFGFERYLNQTLYRTMEWKHFRREIIIRDMGCDLADGDYEIVGKILVHHINPLTIEDIRTKHPKIFDSENVVCTSLNTHNALHYGDENLLMIDPVVRTQYDTCPWKQI